MDYLEKVLGIKAVFEKTEFEHLPNFITTRYQLQAVLLDDISVLYLYPKTELEQINILKKHIERIQKNIPEPIILILNELTSRQKQYLIRERIAFIVEGKQIYLPFMAVYLQERCDSEKHPCDEILPSAQMLFLYFIYNAAHELTTSQAAKDLGLTPTSLSRASKQLAEMGLVKTKKVGVQKILFSTDSPKELFEKAKGRLINPVKKTVYIPKEMVGPNLLMSGYSALSERSMLNAPGVRCYATDHISEWNNVSTDTLYDSESQVAVQMWRYDPHKLSEQGTVDALSLALTLSEDPDERIEETVEEMLESLWRQIDDNRN